MNGQGHNIAKNPYRYKLDLSVNFEGRDSKQPPKCSPKCFASLSFKVRDIDTDIQRYRDTDRHIDRETERQIYSDTEETEEGQRARET